MLSQFKERHSVRFEQREAKLTNIRLGEMGLKNNEESKLLQQHLHNGILRCTQVVEETVDEGA